MAIYNTLMCVFVLFLLSKNVSAVLSVQKAVAVLVGIGEKAPADVEPLKTFYVRSSSHCFNLCVTHSCLSFNLNEAIGNLCAIYTRPALCGENSYGLEKGDSEQNHYVIKNVSRGSSKEEVESWLEACWPRPTTTASPTTTSTTTTKIPTTTTTTTKIPTTTTTTTVPTTTTTTTVPTTTTTTTVPTTTTTTTVPTTTTTTTVPTTTTTTTVPTTTTTTTVPTTTTTTAVPTTSTTTQAATTTTTEAATTTEGICTDGIRIEKLCFLLLGLTTYDDFEALCEKKEAHMAEFPSDTICKQFIEVVRANFPDFPSFFIASKYIGALDDWQFPSGVMTKSQFPACWNGQVPTHEMGKDCVKMAPTNFVFQQVDCKVELRALCVYKID